MLGGIKGRRKVLIILFIAAVVSILIGWRVYKHFYESDHISVIDKNQISEQIEQGNLSDHPASFYQEVGP